MVANQETFVSLGLKGKGAIDMAENDKNFQKTVDEHVKRLFERYKSNAKVFTATHVGHISLSVIFVFSILLPFLYLQIDARETQSELERLAQEISQQDERAATYRQALTGLKKIFEAVENAPKPLEGYIQALEREAAGGPAAPLPEGLGPVGESCGSPADMDPWMVCRIRQYMAARAAQYQEILTHEIAAPLERLNIKEFDQWQADLQNGIKKNTEQIRSEMATNPGFWRDFSQKSPIYQNMVAGVHRFWVDHQFEEIGRRMAQAAEAGRVKFEQLNEKKAQIQKGKEDLNNALKNIKTRFGKIGLEIDEAILLAPVAFAVLFLIAALNLCQNMRLRKSFHRLVQANDPQQAAINDGEIALVMPLWVDPLDPPVKRRLKLGVLMTPAVASALALLVIFYCWTIPGAFPALTGIGYVKYVLYYVLSIGFFFFGFQRIRGAVRRYDATSAEE